MKRNTANENALNRTILTLALASTFVGCSSGTRLFSKTDADSTRRTRGEYAVVDETAEDDWNAAAGRVSVKKPLSLAVDETAENGAAVRAQYASPDDLPPLPPPPKRFSERVKDMFRRPPKEAKKPESPEESFADAASSARTAPPANWNNPASAASSANSAESANAANSGDSQKTSSFGVLGGFGKRAEPETPDDAGFASSGGFATSGGASDSGASTYSALAANRSGSAAPKYGEVRKPVAGGRSWATGVGDGMRRLFGGAPEPKTPDPIAQFDESRFLPSAATFARYRSPLESTENGNEIGSFAAVPEADDFDASAGFATSRTAVSPTRTAPPPTPTSGRALVYGSAPNSNAAAKTAALTPTPKAPKNDAEAFASSGASSRKKAPTPATRQTAAATSAARKTDATTAAKTARKTKKEAPRFESAFGLNDAEAVLVFLVPEARSNAEPAAAEIAAQPTPTNADSTPIPENLAPANELAAEIFAQNAPESTENSANPEPQNAVSTENFAQNAPDLTPNPTSATARTDEKTAANDFAALLGERDFDWFESESTPEIPSAPTPQSAFAQSVSALVPQTVAQKTESNAAPETPELETAPLEAAPSNAESLDVDALLAAPLADENADDFPSWNDVELADDGLAVPANLATLADETAAAETPNPPSPVETPNAETPNPPSPVETSNAETTDPPSLVETPNAKTDAPNSVPKSVDERKTASDAKPPTAEEIAWVEQIKTAIQTLLQSRDAKKARGEDVRADDARLRLLYLAVGEYERAIQEIQDDSDPLKVFWEKECRGLETLLQNRLEEVDPTFVAERLRSGLDSLSGLCDLQIRKAVLATAPACFGLYEERKTPFSPGETLYAYSELDFVSSAETESGFEIEIECRWRLLDADGNERTPFEIQHCATISETKLRDVVLNVAVPLPKNLEPGVYSLETEVVDRNAATPTPATRRIELTVENPRTPNAEK